MGNKKITVTDDSFLIEMNSPTKEDLEALTEIMNQWQEQYIKYLEEKEKDGKTVETDLP